MIEEWSRRRHDQIVLTPEQMTKEETKLTQPQQDAVVEGYGDETPTEDEERFLIGALARVIGDLVLREIEALPEVERSRERKSALERHFKFIHSEIDEYLGELSAA